MLFNVLTGTYTHYTFNVFNNKDITDKKDNRSVRFP